jgi:ribonuclease P protein component
MLPKSRRLTSADVTAVLSSGKAVSHGVVRIKYRPRQERAVFSRFSAIVSKKVAKAATARNRLRRRAYAALSQIPAPRKPIDSAVFILSEAPQATLLSDLKGALSKVL